METAALAKIKQTYSVKVTVRITSLAIHYIHIMHQYTRSVSSSAAGTICLGKIQIFERMQTSKKIYVSHSLSRFILLQLVAGP